MRGNVVQQRGDLGPALHIDGRVVDLGEDREAVRGQVEERVEALDEVQLQSGRVMSSGRAWMRDAWMQNWRQSPGFGSAMWRTWYSRSKRSSSIQYG